MNREFNQWRVQRKSQGKYIVPPFRPPEFLCLVINIICAKRNERRRSTGLDNDTFLSLYYTSQNTT